MVIAHDPNRDRQFRVVVADHHLAGLEELQLRAAANARLIDVRQQGIHFRLAGQLLFKLTHVLRHLLLLLAQHRQIDRLPDLVGVLLLELDLFDAPGFEFIEQAAPVQRPAHCEQGGKHRTEQHAARQAGP